MATPLETLDDAVATFLKEIGEEAALSGWVIGYQLSRFTSDPDRIPVEFASDWTMSAGTSPEAGLGLARLTAARLEKSLLEADEGDE